MAKKKQSRKSYPLELKKKAVKMTQQDGVSVGDVADQLGIPPQQLSQWRSKFLNEEDVELAEKRLDAIDENRKLKEELKQLKMENEILKKAAVFFASQK